MSSLAIKQIKVEEDKKICIKMISDILILFKKNINSMNVLIDSHNLFLHFVETMQLYELYKWDTLKFNYMQIKKKFNKDKKKYKLLTTLYGNVSNYYTLEEREQYHNMIQMIGIDYNNMLYTFVRLNNIHKTINNKCVQFTKNDNYIKIDNITDENQDILIELYQNYIDIKFLNKELSSIKIKKLELKSKLI
jgi:hypothetical protein